MFVRLHKKGETVGDKIVEITTPPALLDSYDAGLNKLIDKVEKTTDDNEMFSMVETEFFAIRVPEEKMQNHLGTLLQVMELKGKGSDSAREEVVELLNGLLN